MRLNRITSQAFKKIFIVQFLPGSTMISTQLLVLVMFIVTLYVTLIVIPVRNIVLYPVVELSWRDVETRDLIRIHIDQEDVPVGLFKIFLCPAVRKPVTSREDISVSGIFSYSHLFRQEARLTALEKGHGRFFPALDVGQKVDIIHLYRVAAEALGSVGLRHFLVSGSLLGLNRHRGFVPWDDDIDIAVGIETWKSVKQELSCFEGFKLAILGAFHWKFHYVNRTYPFIDIFFYRMDEKYIWALTHYIRNVFVYPTRHVFPLTESMFEGVKVPVPYNGLSIARRIYNYDLCKVANGHFSRNMSQTDLYPNGYSLYAVPCSELLYMYNMYQLH